MNTSIGTVRDTFTIYSKKVNSESASMKDFYLINDTISVKTKGKIKQFLLLQK